MNDLNPNIIEKYSVHAFKDLLSVCIGKAMANQVAFNSYLGDYQDYNLDIKSGILTVNEKTFQVSYIGIEDKKNSTWVWADTNLTFPDETILDIVKIMEIGEKYQIKELEDPKINLNEEITGTTLAMIASILLGEDQCYFKGIDGEKNLYMFIKDFNSEELFKPVSIQKFGNIVKKCVTNYDLNQELFIESFLTMNRCEVIKKEDSIIGLFEKNLKCEIVFDEMKRIVKLKFEAIS